MMNGHLTWVSFFFLPYALSPSP